MSLPDRLFVVTTIDGTDCASGATRRIEFTTDDEVLAKAHVEKFKNSWSQAGSYFAVPFKPKQTIEQRRAALNAIEPPPTTTA